MHVVTAAVFTPYPFFLLRGRVIYQWVQLCCRLFLHGFPFGEAMSWYYCYNNSMVQMYRMEVRIVHLVPGSF